MGHVRTKKIAVFFLLWVYFALFCSCAFENYLGWFCDHVLSID